MRWPFMSTKRKLAAMDAEHQRELLKRRAHTAARLKEIQALHDEKQALHDEKMASLIAARQAVGRAQQARKAQLVDQLTPVIYDRIIADLAQVATDGPTYIINEEQELTDV